MSVVPGERRAGRGLKRLPRRIAVAFAVALVSLALIAGLTRPAGRYFYCEAMGMLPVDPCAAAVATDDDDATDATASAVREYHADCCEVVTVLSTPRAVSAQTPAVAPPLTFTSTFERWRVPPRPPGQARAQSMVFLT